MGTARLTIALVLLLLNVIPLLAMYRAASVWIRSRSRRRAVLVAAGLAVLALNIPLGILWFRSLEGFYMNALPATALRAVFYPSLAWYLTALLCTLILAPAYVLWAAGKGARKLARRSEPGAGGVTRRSVLAGGAGLLVPAVYGATAQHLFRSFDDVDISPEMAIPIAHLPGELEGLTIVQLTDLHVGPFIRQREIQHWVGLVNRLHPDLIVLTGDMIDRSVDDLPDLVQGLKGFRSTFGSLAVLGNHDLTSDRLASRGELLGGENIARGLNTIGIRTLRDEVAYLGRGADRLAVMGLDWVNRLGSRNFYRYRPEETRLQLARLADKVEPGTPSILLVHHPDTFSEVPPHGIGLTLAGHTHGGGQVVLYRSAGVPAGLFSSRFKYPGGLFRENGCSLYVNRGLGYFAVPVRINCPPEISRFRLVRPQYSSRTPRRIRPSATLRPGVEATAQQRVEC